MAELSVCVASILYGCQILLEGVADHNGRDMGY